MNIELQLVSPGRGVSRSLFFLLLLEDEHIRLIIFLATAFLAPASRSVSWQDKLERKTDHYNNGGRRYGVLYCIALYLA